MAGLAIRAEGLGKKYVIGAKREQYGTMRDAIAKTVRGSIRRLGNLGGSGESPEEDFWALRDASFTVAHGEVLGIIGPNGAGKSTLLKILSRVTRPSEGTVDVYGRVGSLLEVGTGFHPELTGRENIYLNGAILGMTRNEIKRKFDEIVAFSGIERFLDTPVKRYSSGMFVRLAFSVAAHLEPETLLVDEVLAVGDAVFQKKCMGKMADVVAQDRTILLVSHNMGAIKSLCKTSLLLDSGKIVKLGPTEDVLAEYTRRCETGFKQSDTDSQYELVVEAVELMDGSGRKTLDFVPGSALTVVIHYIAPHRIVKPYFWMGVYGRFGPCFAASMLLDGYRPDFIEGKGTIACTFTSIPLLPNSYTIKLGARDAGGVNFLVPSRDAAFFNVVGRMADYGFKGELADTILWDSCPTSLPYVWRMPDGKTVSVRIKPTDQTAQRV